VTRTTPVHHKNGRSPQPADSKLSPTGFHPAGIGSAGPAKGGTIVGVVPNPVGDRLPCYTVAVDKNSPSATPALLAEDEIQPDG
jgi:hypothetical protein